MKLNEQNLKRMLKLCEKFNVNSDQIDIKAIWDSSLTYQENKTQVLEQLKLIGTPEQKIDKDEQEQIQQDNYKRELEYIAENEKKLLKEIRKSTTPEIDKYYSTLHDYVNILAEGYANSLFLLGSCGLGKTFNCIRYLTEAKKEFVYVVGNISPLAMFHLLYSNKDKIIVFDDTQALLTNNVSMSILMGALWSSKGKRIVEWHSTSGKLNAPSRFEFEGQIIFTLNDIPDNEQIRTLLSRCLIYNVKFSYYEILKIMTEIAKLPHKKLSKKERMKVISYIQKNTDETTKDFNLRLQAKLENIYLYSPEKFKKLALTLIEKDRFMFAIKELTSDGLTIDQQIKEWIRETGLSRRSYFRYKDRLKELQLPNS